MSRVGPGSWWVLGLRVWRLGFRVWSLGLGVGVWGLGFGSRVWVRVRGFGFQCLGERQALYVPHKIMGVRVFIFWLSGLFCCFGFSGVYVFAVWAGSCFVFCCLGGGAGPAQTATKKTRPRPNSKNINTPPPLPSVFCFLLFGQGCGRFFLLFVRGEGGGFAVWAGAFFFFFAVWAGGVFVCCGGVHVLFAVWAGDGSSLTYRSAWLVFKRPNNKKDQTAKKKKNTGSR